MRSRIRIALQLWELGFRGDLIIDMLKPDLAYCVEMYHNSRILPRPGGSDSGAR
jgi:hypothetical protein